ncbi:glycosyltransferase family 2 protein [Herbaspirillum sp. SJZ099]|uniref:glycosyltransferase family 2 protein n=1 Tax=Herbaspirillum sp. SJZ099 TaxID=2572916 RepID=UPI0011A37EA7|nr:glycosyltransferase family 2 protein [Herbaspirillum sp. SJZ099]
MQKISIITVSYNSEATIADTLHSINEQTYENLEYLVIDGGSKDRTMELVENNGKRIALKISEKDRGIYDAYNKGLALAQGEIIGFLNSDDFYCDRTAIEKVMRVFEDPQVDACYADLVYVDRDDTSKIVRHWKSRPYKEGLFKQGFVPAHPTLFLRKKVYEQAGGFNLDYRLAADYEFMLRIFHKHNLHSAYLPEILVKMRDGGATGGSLKSIRKQNTEIVKALEQHGVSYSKAHFFLHKLANRFCQKIRAKFVTLDT